MVNNPWKITTLGILALGATSLTSTVTTAYLMRPTVDAGTPAASAPVWSAEANVTSAGSRPVAAVRRPTSAPVAVDPAPVIDVTPAATAAVIPDPKDSAAQTPAPVASAPAAPVPVTASPTVASEPRANDCDTAGERTWRIAKPGLIGSVVGAGLGAAGGAIADGGKGAGKGAIIGGLAGAAAGGGYGAYKTKNACGTIFGDGEPRTVGGAAPAPAASAPTVPGGEARAESSLQTWAPPAAGAESITIYRAR